ncbi:MAG: DUF3024 domain-containing protein [Opitutaceae bacterium]|nr:DUF3024 domain-containing protein [Opitutaceae bacterium]
MDAVPAHTADVLANVGRFIARHRPRPEIRDQLDFRADVSGSEVILSEVRPNWKDPTIVRAFPFAKLKWVKSRRFWKLYWKRASGKWEPYVPEPSFPSIEAALAVISADEYGCFFG